MRPEAQAKLGYYPTPPDVIPLIAQHLKAECPHPTEPDWYHERTGGLFVLDPCCGTGDAVKSLMEAVLQHVEHFCGHTHRGFAYGAEIHETRARQAQQTLRRCAAAPPAPSRPWTSRPIPSTSPS